MKESNAKIFGIVSIAAALVSLVGRLLPVLFFTDEKFGVYSKGSLFPQVFGYFVAVICIGLAIWGAFSKKDFSGRKAPASTPFTVFTTAVLGFIMLAFVAILIFSRVNNGPCSTFEIILIISALFSGIYYLSLIFSRKSNPNMFAIISMSPIVWGVTSLIELYFDMTVLISSPSRIWVQLAFLSFMVFTLAETRFNIYYESTPLYAPSAAIATIFLLSVSVSNLVCLDKMMIGNTERPITYVIMLAAGLYSLSKLVSFCFISERIDEN